MFFLVHNSKLATVYQIIVNLSHNCFFWTAPVILWDTKAENFKYSRRGQWKISSNTSLKNFILNLQSQGLRSDIVCEAWMRKFWKRCQIAVECRLHERYPDKWFTINLKLKREWLRVLEFSVRERILKINLRRGRIKVNINYTFLRGFYLKFYFCCSQIKTPYFSYNDEIIHHVNTNIFIQVMGKQLAFSFSYKNYESIRK